MAERPHEVFEPHGEHHNETTGEASDLPMRTSVEQAPPAPADTDAAHQYESSDSEAHVSLLTATDSRTSQRGEIKVDLNAARSAASQALSALISVKPIRSNPSGQSTSGTTSQLTHRASASKPTLSRRASGPPGSSAGAAHLDPPGDTAGLRSSASRGATVGPVSVHHTGQVGADASGARAHAARVAPGTPPPPQQLRGAPLMRATTSLPQQLLDSGAYVPASSSLCLGHTVLNPVDTFQVSPFSVYHQLATTQQQQQQQQQQQASVLQRHMAQRQQQAMFDMAAGQPQQTALMRVQQGFAEPQQATQRAALVSGGWVVDSSAAAAGGGAFIHAAPQQPQTLRFAHAPPPPQAVPVFAQSVFDAGNTGLLLQQTHQPMPGSHAGFMVPHANNATTIALPPASVESILSQLQPQQLEQLSMEDVMALAQLLDSSNANLLQQPAAAAQPAYQQATAAPGVAMEQLAQQLAVMDVNGGLDAGTRFQLAYQQQQQQMLQVLQNAPRPRSLGGGSSHGNSGSGSGGSGGVHLRSAVGQATAPPPPPPPPPPEPRGSSGGGAAASVVPPLSILHRSQILQQQQQQHAQQGGGSQVSRSEESVSDAGAAPPPTSDDRGAGSSGGDGSARGEKPNSPWLVAYQLACQHAASTARAAAADGGNAGLLTVKQLVAEHQLLLSVLVMLLRWSSGALTGNLLLEELNSLSSASRTHKDTHAEGLTGGAQLGMSLAASTLAARAAAAAASLPLEITQAAQQLTAQLITDPSQQPPPLTPADMFTFTKVAGRHLSFLSSLRPRQGPTKASPTQQAGSPQHAHTTPTTTSQLRASRTSLPTRTLESHQELPTEGDVADPITPAAAARSQTASPAPRPSARDVPPLDLQASAPNVFPGGSEGGASLAPGAPLPSVFSPRSPHAARNTWSGAATVPNTANTSAGAGLAPFAHRGVGGLTHSGAAVPARPGGRESLSTRNSAAGTGAMPPVPAGFDWDVFRHHRILSMSGESVGGASTNMFSGSTAGGLDSSASSLLSAVNSSVSHVMLSSRASAATTTAPGGSSGSLWHTPLQPRPSVPTPPPWMPASPLQMPRSSVGGEETVPVSTGATVAAGSAMMSAQGVPAFASPQAMRYPSGSSGARDAVVSWPPKMPEGAVGMPGGSASAALISATQAARARHATASPPLPPTQSQFAGSAWLTRTAPAPGQSDELAWPPQ